VIVFYFLLSLVFLTGARVLARAVNDRRLPGFARAAPRRRSVLIVGAGQGGRLVCQELTRNADLGLHPVGFVDDDPLKQRLRFEGVRVRGTTRELPRILDEAEPDEVIIAIPSAPGELRMRVVTACRERAIPVRTLPTVFEMLSGTVGIARRVRDVQVEDVLGREAVRVDLEPGRSLPAGGGRDGHRRGRLDRLRAVPPDLARRAAPAGPARPRRGQHVRDPAGARGGPARPARRARAGPRGLQGGGADAGGPQRGDAVRSSSTPPPTSTSA
jgi:hypothetical protein